MLLLIALTAFFAAGCAAVGGTTAEVHRRDSTTLGLRPGVSVQGAWRLVETAVRTPGDAWDVRPAPQGGLFVFSSRQYSYFYLRGTDPRPRFVDANRPTDTERAATYDTFIAGAGSYVLDGRAVVLTADFRKNPNEMTGDTWRWEAETAGDTLRFIFANPPFLTPPPRKHVLFVCEHGTVRSLLAMKLFDEYAAKVGLRMHAVSRGTLADSAVPPWMLKSLAADQMLLGSWKPQTLRARDLATASLVVSFDIPPAATAHTRAPRAHWNGLPSVGADYAKGRDAIKVRVYQLVDSLKRAEKL